MIFFHQFSSFSFFLPVFQLSLSWNISYSHADAVLWFDLIVVFVRERKEKRIGVSDRTFLDTIWPPFPLSFLCLLRVAVILHLQLLTSSLDQHPSQTFTLFIHLLALSTQPQDYYCLKLIFKRRTGQLRVAGRSERNWWWRWKDEEEEEEKSEKSEDESESWSHKNVFEKKEKGRYW